MSIPTEPTPPAFTKARDAYLREARRPGNRLARLLSILIHRLFTRRTGALCLIVAVTGITIGLCV